MLPIWPVSGERCTKGLVVSWRSADSRFVWILCESATMGFRQTAGSVCRALLCDRSDRGQGAVSTIPDDADPCGRRIDRNRRPGHHVLEGLIPQDVLPPRF